MNVKDVILKNLGFSSLTASTHVLMFLTLILGARFLGDSDFGTFSFAYAFAEVVNVIVDFGFHPHLIRSMARDESQSAHMLGNLLSMRAISYLMLSLLVFPVLYLSSTPRVVFLAICLTMPQYYLKGYQMLFRGVFQANNLFHHESISVAIDRIFTFVLCTAVLLSGGRVIGFALMFVIGKLMSVLYLLWKLNSLHLSLTRLRFDVQEWPSLLRSSIPFALSIIFGEIYFRIDTVMLGYLRGSVEVGWYSAAYNLFEGLIGVSLVVATSIYPLIAKYHIESSEMVKRIFSNAIKMVLIVFLPVLITGVYLSQELILAVYGMEYANASVLLQVLLFAALPLSVGILCSQVLAGINAERIIVVVTGAGALINIVANLIAIPMLGARGAALATVITEFSVLSLMLYHLRGYVRVTVSDVSFVFKVILASLMTLLLGITLGPDLNVFILLTCLGVFYLLVLYLMRVNSAFVSYSMRSESTTLP